MQRVIIKSRRQVAQDVLEFELVGDGAELLPFTAGSHVDVFLPSGTVRQYSLCNDPSETARYLLGVLKDPNSRGGSVEMHSIQEGASLVVSAPRNCFPLADPQAISVLFAGGIGVTPLLAMAHELHRRGTTFEFHFCARSQDRAAFASDIAGLPFAGRVRFYFDDQGHKLDLDSLVAGAAQGTHFYACGPAGFIGMLEAAATSCGRRDFFHSELFAAPPVSESENTAFNMVLAKSQRTVTVSAGQTALDALRKAGIAVMTSCEQGVCGTCLTKVIEGVPDHRDMYLTDEEKAANDVFLPCCSRAKTPELVVDL